MLLVHLELSLYIIRFGFKKQTNFSFVSVRCRHSFVLGFVSKVLFACPLAFK